MFVSPAWAQSAGGGGLGGLEQLLPLVLIFVVFYFLLIRPQQKKAKVHREMLSNLRRGDRIVTNGGLIGTITRVPNETELILEVADGVKVRVLRGMIAESMNKGEPASTKAKKDKDTSQAEDEQNSEDENEEDADALDADTDESKKD